MAENPVQHELFGLSAVVTGSSSGIGRAIALELAAAGANVLVHARCSRDRAEAVAAEIRALGRKTHVILADLSDEHGQDQFAHEAWAWQDGVDIWINNAGADVLTGDAADWSFEQKLEVLWQVDVMATLRLSRHVGGLMKERGRGTILNMGWDQAETGMGGNSGELFSTTKGAVMAFTKSLARSLAPQVRVNCLAPGWIRTSWGDQASEYWQDRVKRECLLERWGTPEDVARIARFLASPAAAFVTGQVMPINGGLRTGRGDSH